MIAIISIVLMLAIAGGIVYYNIAPYYRKIYSAKVWADVDETKDEKILFDFVSNKLTGEDGGVHTNYLNQSSNGDITKGHAVLSESQGLMLLYDLEKNDRNKFDITLEYIKNNMLLQNNLLSWRVDENEETKTSATIDDLRVIKALLLADEKWNNKDYRKLALKIAKGIKKESLDKGNYVLTDFYDGYNKSDTTTLCYLDLPTLRMLANLDYSWKKVYDKSVEILNGGYINDRLPLYRKIYYRNSNSYDENEDADTLLSMIVALNKLAEGQDISTTVEWIRKEFQQNGKIFATYNISKGIASSEFESTSSYAMIVQIASIIGDEEIQKYAMNRMKEFQIKNQNSEVYGGFGSEDGTNVFSYDNLNALLAYRNYRVK
ncbi:MAG: glycosyl hydrolase family 8 [Clostridium butyricum]|nr:glycosyl hydrolase family 8 [Clostridium butyricum]